MVKQYNPSCETNPINALLNSGKKISRAAFGLIDNTRGLSKSLILNITSASRSELLSWICDSVACLNLYEHDLLPRLSSPITRSLLPYHIWVCSKSFRWTLSGLIHEFVKKWRASNNQLQNVPCFQRAVCLFLFHEYV